MEHYELGLLAVSRTSLRREQIQMARTAAHGEHQRALGPRSNQRFAVGLFQRRGLRELGEYLGNLEPTHTARRRSAASRRDNRAGDGRFARQRALGATRSHASKRNLREPLSPKGSYSLAIGQSHR